MMLIELHSPRARHCFAPQGHGSYICFCCSKNSASQKFSWPLRNFPIKALGLKQVLGEVNTMSCKVSASRVAGSVNFIEKRSSEETSGQSMNFLMHLPELIGCKVQDRKGTSIGIVEDVIEAGLGSMSPPVIKIVNHQPAGVPIRDGLQEVHLIPYVPEIFKEYKSELQTITIWPPEGLLQLGRQQLLLDIIGPQIVALAEAKSEETVESGMEGKLRFLKMPTRKDLEAEGHTRLVRGIMSAGGFSSVAQRLGLRTRRRPNGFWEDLGNVDEELSYLVAASWVEYRDEDGETYFYNPISGRTSLSEPQAPVKIPLDDNGTMLLAEDEEDRVMPTKINLLLASRYDLDNAISFHGGYRQVARDLERIPSRSRHKLAGNMKALLKELEAAQIAVFGKQKPGEKIMPSNEELQEAGYGELVHAISASGGFRSVAGQAGYKCRRRQHSYWADEATVVAEIKAYLKEQCGQKQHRLPTHAELMQAGRHDLKYALQIYSVRSVGALERPDASFAMTP